MYHKHRIFHFRVLLFFSGKTDDRHTGIALCHITCIIKNYPTTL